MVLYHLTVEEELAQEFRRLVFERHGKIRGALKEETEKAIKQHIQSLSRGR